MKVKHLIRELTKVDPELDVITEGCDCFGNTYKIEVDRWNQVVIRREPPSTKHQSPHTGGEYSNVDDTPEPL